jgi:hypothetical protein
MVSENSWPEALSDPERSADVHSSLRVGSIRLPIPIFPHTPPGTIAVFTRYLTEANEFTRQNFYGSPCNTFQSWERPVEYFWITIERFSPIRPFIRILPTLLRCSHNGSQPQFYRLYTLSPF